MSTPAYLGTGQPASDNGGTLLGRFGSFFGSGGTPAYSGIGQPTTSAVTLGGNAPAYASAPVAAQPLNDMTDDSEAAQVVMSCPIDSGALAAGQIAIVIPRQGSRDE